MIRTRFLLSPLQCLYAYKLSLRAMVDKQLLLNSQLNIQSNRSSSLRKKNKKMAASPSNPKTSYHSRSISLPSRPHPIVPQIDEHLCRLKSSQATSSSSSITHSLDGLIDLNACIDNLLALPFAQQGLAQECHKRWVDELLDGSLRLLDVCSIVKDALFKAKECTNEVQFVMHRRRVGEMDITNEIRKYFGSRKIIRRAIKKALKGIENKSNDKNHETLTMVKTLKEVEAVTVSIFESLLCFIAGPKLRSKSSRWFSVSKLVRPNKVSREDEETNINEIEKANLALESLMRTGKNVDDPQISLANLELTIQDLEEVTDRLFRSLIKTRVSLLNIFNN